MALFIDGTCPCQTSELYDYVIVIYDNPEDCAGEFIQTHGKWVLSAYQFDNFDKFDQAFALRRTKVWRRVKAFTIAEAFNYIEMIDGGDKRPRHRIIDFDENAEIFSCSYITKLKPAEPDERARIIAEMRARLSARVSNVNSQSQSGSSQ